MPAVSAATSQVLSTESPVEHGQRTASCDTSLIVSGGVENDVAIRLTNIPSTSCDIDLRPPDRLCPCHPGGDLCQFALQSVYSFSKYSVQNLVRDFNCGVAFSLHSFNSGMAFTLQKVRNGL